MMSSIHFPDSYMDFLYFLQDMEISECNGNFQRLVFERVRAPKYPIQVELQTRLKKAAGGRMTKSFFEITHDPGVGDVVAAKCKSNCTCPAGSTWYQGVNDVGTSTSGCSPESEGGNDESCPSGYPKVNGECPVCPTGFNPDGSCIGSSCPTGQITQGYINGSAICQGTCSDSKQRWGSVNGVEGCYGPCTCSNGGSYGSVNGIPGCYGGTGAGSCGGSGSNTSSGSGTGQGSDGIDNNGNGLIDEPEENTGNGSGSGSGGEDGGGNGGNSGGGSGGGGSNNDVGTDYPEQVACPDGFVKEGSKCVTEDKGDCPVDYHQVVVSSDPFLFWCVPDDQPQSSSSQQASSSPSSQAQSSQNNSQQNSSTNASSGSNTSSGSGGNTGGSGEGSGGSGSGACDPTSENYLECISSGDEFTEGQKGSFDDELAKQEQQQLEQQINQKITDIKSQISEKLGGRISSSGSITDYCKKIHDVNVCFGLSKFSSYLPVISQAIFLVACVFAFYVVLGR